MLRRGWWTKLHHGVYADSRDVVEARTRESLHLLRLAAGIHALPGNVAAFGPSAAILHGLPIQRSLRDSVHLLRTRAADSRALRRRVTGSTLLEDVTVHGFSVSDDQLTNVRGLPAVDVDSAAVSAAAMSHFDWAVVTLDSAAWKTDSAQERFMAVLERWSTMRGAGTAKRAIDACRSGAQSPLETLSRLRLIRCGLPEPLLQVPIHDSQGLIGVVDMLWDEWRVIGEADGAVKYATRDDVIAEKNREDRLRRAGYAVARWTWPEIMRDPGMVAGRIEAAVRLSARAS